MRSSVRDQFAVCAILGALVCLSAAAVVSSRFIERRLRLTDGRLEVMYRGAPIWASPASWRVQDAQIGDVNGDGVEDIVALVDAPGEFGSIRPFWIPENDPSTRQHLYIFDIIDGVFHPVWMTSRIYAQTCAFSLRPDPLRAAVDLVTEDDDGPVGNADCSAQKTSLWRWNGWGFSLVSSTAP